MHDVRPHQSLEHCTALEAFAAREKVGLQGQDRRQRSRIRRDRFDKAGQVTLGFKGKLHHIEVGKDDDRWRGSGATSASSASVPPDIGTLGR